MGARLEIRRLGVQDLGILSAVPEGLFDFPVDAGQAAAFLADPGHEIVAGFSDGVMVAMATGTVLLHPDKPPCMFVNEVGVREEYRQRGIATLVLEQFLEVARARGCEGIWLGTEGDNGSARALYLKVGGRETKGLVIYDWDGVMDEG